MCEIAKIPLAVLLLAVVIVGPASAATTTPPDWPARPAEVEVALAPQQPQQQQQQQEQQEESYQRVYEAFSRLMANISTNSLANARRLVHRLNRLVGDSSRIDDRTDQILDRLDRVDRNRADEQTLAQLGEDVNRLIGTLNNSYLRNIRRVIERVNRVVGQPSASSGSGGPSGGGGPAAASPATASPADAGPAARQFQSGDHLNDDPLLKQPGFPGIDEILVAMDRVQKSLAHFVRSSTRFITSGR